MRAATQVTMAIGLILVPLFGCGPAETPPEVDEVRVEPAPPPAPVEKAEQPQPGLELPQARGPQCVKNMSFETWEDGKPAGWRFVPEGSIRPSQEARSGNRALEMLSSGDDYTNVTQFLTREPIPPGSTVQVSCLAKASESNQLVVKLVYRRDGERVDESEINRAVGEWRPIAFPVTIPEDADPTSIAIRLLRRGNTSGVVLVDDVSVKVAD